MFSSEKPCIVGVESCIVGNLYWVVYYCLWHNYAASILFDLPIVVVNNNCRHNWSSDGCYVNTKLSNSNVVVCECSHLTHFAILLSPGLNVRSLLIGRRWLVIMPYWLFLCSSQMKKHLDFKLLDMSVSLFHSFFLFWLYFRLPYLSKCIFM